MTDCPGRLALCGVPCGCDGENPSHYTGGGHIPSGPVPVPVLDTGYVISRAQLEALSVDVRTLVTSACTCPPSANLGEGEHLPTCMEAAA